MLARPVPSAVSPWPLAVPALVFHRQAVPLRVCRVIEEHVGRRNSTRFHGFGPGVLEISDVDRFRVDTTRHGRPCFDVWTRVWVADLSGWWDPDPGALWRQRGLIDFNSLPFGERVF